MKKGNKISTVIKFLIIVIGSPTFAQNADKQILWTTDWSPNGQLIAIGGNTDTLKIYSEKDIKPFKLFAEKNTITRVKWHPTKNIIAVTTQMSEGKSNIVNLETNKKIELIGISPDGARGIDWNYTGEYLAVADNDGQISIYDI